MNRTLTPLLRARAVLLLTRAHLLEFFREPGILFWAFGFPLLLSWALGLAFLTPHRVRVTLLVSEADSAAIRAALPDTGAISLRAVDALDAVRALRRGEAAGMVTEEAGSPVLHLDTTTQEGNLARLLADRAHVGKVESDLRVEAPRAFAGSYADFLFPGMLALGLMNGCVWGIGFALMDLRLRKLLRLFAATPLSRFDILLSVVLARGATLPLENALLWGFGVLVFGVAMHGSALLFVAVAASAAASFAGLGILGASRVEQCLPPLVEAIRRQGRQVLWCCDPMHGNTETTRSGIKTRHFDKILGELEQSYRILKTCGAHLGGVHFELTGDNVTECIGGASGVTEADLSRDYRTTLDPRLNYEQAMEMALRLARLMSQNGG